MEVTLKVFKSNGTSKYKVTRRIPEHYVAETKMFDDKDEALKQFNEWLQ